MELFYNPERMSETEIKETFVAYQWLVDEIVSIIKRQPKGAGVQHIVIVAPRGMGKTTLLLMLRFTVLSQDLAKRWQPVLFPEESYSVYDLADLWVEVLDHVASETGEAALHDEVKNLKAAHPNSSSLEAVALANIKDWRDKNKKRLLLLVDNFDMILEQIGDEKDNASLRDVLMNDGTIMLVGGSTTFFKEARAYDQPLYNLFKIYNLNGLDSDQMEELLRRRAKIDGLENFEEILRANRSRLRVLEYFTGGNPRLVLMLYRVLTHSDISEVRHGLEKLLDEVTPYYKAKIEALPPQQRKILDQIARISAQTREGLTPTEIASATRLAVNQVSSQLKRLADVGYVRAANIRGRSSYYTLSEPLYAIWHQMRFGRDPRARMNWLIAFLKSWYDAEQLGTECERLQDLFRKYLRAGREKDARDALEHRRYLVEAIEDKSSRAHTFESIVLSYLELRDIDALKRDVLRNVDTSVFSMETCQRLIAAGLISEEQARSPYRDDRSRDIQETELAHVLSLAQEASLKGDLSKAKKIFTDLEKHFPSGSYALLLLRAQKAFLLQNWDECLDILVKLMQRVPDLDFAWRLKGLVLLQNSRFEEAVIAFTRAVEIDPSFENHYLLAEVLLRIGRKQEALTSIDQALQSRPDSFDGLYTRSKALRELNRTDEALATIDMALSLQPDSPEGWFRRGTILAKKELIEEALTSFYRASELKPTSFEFLLAISWALQRQNRINEALDYVSRMIQLKPDAPDAYFMRGNLLAETDSEAAVMDLRRAFDLTSKSNRLLVDSLQGKALKVMLSVAMGEINKVKEDWQDLVQHPKSTSDPTELKEISNVAIFIAGAGHWKLADELIISSNLQEPLFPLVRALEFLIKGEDASIEKLSPEVRQIAEEIAGILRASSDNNEGHTKKMRSRAPVRAKVNRLIK